MVTHGKKGPSYGKFMFKITGLNLDTFARLLEKIFGVL